MITNWTHIIIHHSLTKDGSAVSWDAIRKYHMDPNGPYKMKDIGYHYGIELIGSHYEILVGRQLTEVGAHCVDMGMNKKGIGICLIGNFDVETPGEERVDLALRLCQTLIRAFNIPALHVLGHRETGANKSCPGKLFDMGHFRSNLT